MFKRKAERLWQIREDNGEESIYSHLQPFYHPELPSLVVERIDYHACFGKAGLRWCQGEVLSVALGKSKPKVNVLWDAMPDVDKYKDETEEEVVLLPSKWNKDCNGAWRMDVDIAIGDNEDDFEDQMVEQDNGGESDGDED